MYAKTVEGVQVKIPYSTGMSPYSGLVDMAEKAGLLVKDGNRLRFGEADSANEIKMFRKAWELNEGGCLDTIMATYGKVEEKISIEDIETMDDNAIEQQAPEPIVEVITEEVK